MAWGLTDAGFVAPRAIDFRDVIRSSWNAYLASNGLEQIDWEYDLDAAMIVDAQAAQLGQIGEAVQALWDARRMPAATGQSLIDIGAIRGLEKLSATKSRATVALDGTAAQTVPDGASIIIADNDGVQHTWKLLESVVLPDDGIFEAVEDGAITAAAGLATIVTAYPWWSANTGSATVGTDVVVGRSLESDAAYRRRMAAPPGRGNTVDGMRNAIAAVDGVLATVVVQNVTNATATVSGISIPAHTMVSVVYPDTITDDQKEDVAQAIYDHLGGGVATDGTVYADIARGNGQVERVYWRYATNFDIAVDITVTLFSTYVLADVEDDITTAVETLFATYLLGDPVTRYDIQLATAGIAGIKALTITLNGVGADITPTAIQHPNLTTTVVH